jgi:hypothetical protein
VLTLSHSSHARPAPNPRPTNAGHARRLKRRTEKTTPKPRPRPERMTMEERQRSHCECIVSRHASYTSAAARVHQCSSCIQSGSRDVANASRRRVVESFEATPSTLQLPIASSRYVWGLYLLVQQGLAHGARGARDGRCGLG